ncbi:MAG: 4-hydroxy-tetrahydrodipicolinate synthase, partial [Paramuribaculum sp.]|nr:4-hydroxy-tetrahydrodipicolinate synthase [Paramuribaculum sp.]
MVRPNLTGLGVALITPFRADKSVDYDALARLLEYQIKNGTDYLVVLGTTAETPALTPDERRRVRDFVADRVAGRVPLVLGCGGNCTAAVVEELQTVPRDKYCAVLAGVPYYNKTSQEGIYRNYAAIAEATPLPVVLYNVPGRTGVNMTAETTLRLAHEFPGTIVAIKEASGKIDQVDEIIKRKPEEFMVISGDDGITYPLITLGAVGVISVVGNAFPR